MIRMPFLIVIFQGIFLSEPIFTDVADKGPVKVFSMFFHVHLANFLVSVKFVAEHTKFFFNI